MDLATLGARDRRAKADREAYQGLGAYPGWKGLGDTEVQQEAQGYPVQKVRTGYQAQQGTQVKGVCTGNQARRCGAFRLSTLHPMIIAYLNLIRLGPAMRTMNKDKKRP